jgi:hypothetical protein
LQAKTHRLPRVDLLGGSSLIIIDSNCLFASRQDDADGQFEYYRMCAILVGTENKIMVRKQIFYSLFFLTEEEGSD